MPHQCLNRWAASQSRATGDIEVNQKKIAVVILSLALLLSACQTDGKPVEPVVIDPVELQAFADTFFAEQMETLHIPGVTFIFVQGGEVVYARGYGYANLETVTSITVDSSVVRIGSISKPFVASAVMQLVEQGKLDLHTDINQYLTAFQLENTFPKPVTLAHLLTHTGGFLDPPYVTYIDPQEVQPLGPFLAANMPSPTYLPGEVFNYSNYGYALAALIVEEVSDIPFDQYVEQNIFIPLKMTHSSYLLAPPLPEHMVTGYQYRDGEQIPQPVDYDDDYPGGSIISTAEDMSHFMLAHLGDGCYQGGCILKASTLAEMHQRQAETPYEGQNVTFGFVEGIQNGQRLLGHSGAIRGFGNSLDMLPEYNAGYFFSFNEECLDTSACQIVTEFRNQFLERFLCRLQF
jgi:CubicO group peptidase (beta-lactamase class C family)